MTKPTLSNLEKIKALWKQGRSAIIIENEGKDYEDTYIVVDGLTEEDMQHYAHFRGGVYLKKKGGVVEYKQSEELNQTKFKIEGSISAGEIANPCCCTKCPRDCPICLECKNK